MQFSTSSDRRAERTARRAATLFVAGDIILSEQPLPAACSAALDPDVRETLTVVSLETAAVATVTLIYALYAALDGTLVIPHTSRVYIDYAHTRGLPIYALLVGGPNPSFTDTAAIQPRNNEWLLLPDQYQAVVTDRALYRPSMLARYLTDGDAPLDVIPLS